MYKITATIRDWNFCTSRLQGSTVNSKGMKRSLCFDYCRHSKYNANFKGASRAKGDIEGSEQ